MSHVRLSLALPKLRKSRSVRLVLRCLQKGGQAAAQKQATQPDLDARRDHKFCVLAERGVFKCMKGASGGASVKLEKKQKPNAKCACGSGKKYKKCCGSYKKKCTIIE